MKNEYTRIDQVPVYSATELEELTGIDRRKIPFHKTRFIPVKVITKATAKNKKGYSLKYVDYKDVKVYMIYARKDEEIKEKPKKFDSEKMRKRLEKK